MKYKERDVFLFGIGNNFFSYADRLDMHIKIKGFIDNNPKNWGTSPFGDERLVISPEEMKNYDNPLAIVIPINRKAIEEIKAQCNNLGVETCLASEVLNDCFTDDNFMVNWPETIQKEKIHRFIDLQLRDTTTCNFHCPYCYVWRHDGYKEEKKTSEFSPSYIRESLSLKRLGGACFINICASGETMISKDIVSLVFELLKEGHYVSVVTNGTISKKINEILSIEKKYLKRMFFKLSYHYFELKRTKLEKTFWENVNLIKNSPCSYTIEITPHDELIPYISEIKTVFKEKANGAMPHVTFTRDSTKINLDLFSKLSLDDYKKTWGQFNSKLFYLKKNLYYRKITEYCYAGNWSMNISLQSGNMQTCYGNKDFYPFFENVKSLPPIKTIGHNCAIKYCFNGHAFLAFGALPEIQCDSYFDMRDRIDKDGNHWIKPFYARAIKQKLYDNNFIYHNTWPDYEKLFEQNRKPAFILFNSPDYSNLGDHAIAIGTERFFRKYFPNLDFIQIACEEYVLENLKIKNAIQTKDILLISGGGYLGTLWPRLDDIVRHIVSTYTNNKIFILPQTLYYEDSNFAKCESISEARCFALHKNLHIALREEKSYKIAQKLFLSNKVIFAPDMALNLRYVDKINRKNALICFRKDKEAVCEYTNNILEIIKEIFVNYKEIDTVITENINMINRNEKVEDLLKILSSAEIVFTDRLHAMILCVITKTPCLFFDNVSQKLSANYELFKNFNYIKMHQENADIIEEINLLLSLKMISDDWSSIEQSFYKYAQYIKVEIGDIL